MTKRAADLTKSAKVYLLLERSAGKMVSREMVRDMLADRARELGFASNEVRSAVDNAIKHAGVFA